jgi:hypothetical protein
MKKTLLIISIMIPAVHAMHNQPSADSVRQSIENLKRINALQKELLAESFFSMSKFKAINQALDQMPVHPSHEENSTSFDESEHKTEPANAILFNEYRRLRAEGKNDSQKILEKLTREQNRQLFYSRAILVSSAAMVTSGLWGFMHLYYSDHSK